jgi:DNA-binding NtrC family response regulator
LRERREDIPHFVDYFLEKQCRKNGKNIVRMEEAAVLYLKEFNWPGNIRQLENAVEMLVVLGDGNTITLPEVKRHLEARERKPVDSEIKGLEEVVRKEAERIEKELILRALERCSGNITKAAEELKISRKTLHNKINQYGLKK